MAVHNHQHHNHTLIKSASYFSVVIGLFIMSIKVYGWLDTSSSSIMASLIDSMLDISASLINVIAIRYALAPPDDNHRFGHDKIQDIAIFAQSSFFLCSGLFALFSSIKSLITGHIMEGHVEGIVVITLATIANVVLVVYQTYVIRKTKSKIIEADKLHYFVDFLTNVAVIISLFLSQYFWYIDSVFGIGISIYIILSAAKLLRFSLKNLTDEETSKHDKDKIISILGQFSEILGVHELKTRHAGDKMFIQFHLELDPDMTLFKAHKISDAVASGIEAEFPNCEIMIHQDPAGYENNVKFKEI